MALQQRSAILLLLTLIPYSSSGAAHATTPPPRAFGTFGQFERWFADAGGETRSIELNASGVFATSFLARGDLVLSVPRRVIMCRETLVAAAGTKDERRSFGKIKRDDDLLTVALMLEEAKLQQHEEQRDLAPGRWADYVAVLPLKTMLLPIFFSAAELAELQDNELVERVREQRSALEKRYKKLRTIINRLFRENSFSKVQRKEMASLDRFLRAASLVGSHALTLRGERFLIPYVDMIRFAPRNIPPSERWFRRPGGGAAAASPSPRTWPWSARKAAEGVNAASTSASASASAFDEISPGDRFLLYHRFEKRPGKTDEMFAVYADRDTRKGEALLEDYGEHRNEVYFMHHGFVPRPRSNPSNCVQVPLPSVAQALWYKLQLGTLPNHPDIVDLVVGFERAIAMTRSSDESPAPSEMLRVWRALVQMVAEKKGDHDRMMMLGVTLRSPAVTVSPCIATAPGSNGVVPSTGLPQLMAILRLCAADLRDLHEGGRGERAPRGAPSRAKEGSGKRAAGYTSKQLRDMGAALEPWKLYSADSAEVKERDRAWTARAFSFLRGAIVARLARLPTTLREDERLYRQQRRLRSDAAGNNEMRNNETRRRSSRAAVLLSRSTMLALRFRIAQKTTLTDALLWLGHAAEENMTATSRGIQTLAGSDCDCSRAPVLSANALALEDWLLEEGAYIEPLRTAMVGQGMRLGLVTQRAITRNETILAVPLRLVMNAAQALNVSAIADVLNALSVTYVRTSRTSSLCHDRFPSHSLSSLSPLSLSLSLLRVHSYPSTEDNHHALLFLLLYEARVLQRGASQWTPYLRTLPTEAEFRAELPAYFDETVLSELEPSELAGDIRRYQRYLKSTYARVKQRVFDRFPDVFPPEKCDFDAYRWAHLVLDTRATWWNGEVHLLPMRDLINAQEWIPTNRRDRVWGHSMGEAEEIFPLDPPTIESIDGEDFAVVRTSIAYPIGQQLFESYDASKHDLFLFHGFVPLPELPSGEETSDCVRITLSLDDAAAPLEEAKKKTKTNAADGGDAGGTNAISVEVNEDGSAYDAQHREEINAKLRMASKMQQLRSIGIYDTQRTFCVRPGAPAPSLLTLIRVIYGIEMTDTGGALQQLAELCKERVRAYSTTVAEDRKILQKLTVGDKLQRIIRFRMGEKLLLIATISSLEEIVVDLEQSALIDGLIAEL